MNADEHRYFFLLNLVREKREERKKIILMWFFIRVFCVFRGRFWFYPCLSAFICGLNSFIYSTT